MVLDDMCFQLNELRLCNCFGGLEEVTLSKQ